MNGFTRMIGVTEPCQHAWSFAPTLSYYQCDKCLERHGHGTPGYEAIAKAQADMIERFTAPKVASDTGAGLLRTISRAIHEHLCRRDIMQYLDNDEDCEGLARAVTAALATDATDGATGGGEVERCRALVESVKAGQFDTLDAAADQWSESAGVQRMSNAIASVFEKYAPQDIMDRFREKITALMHLAFVEGAGQGVLQVAPLATTPGGDLLEQAARVRQMTEAEARDMLEYDADTVISTMRDWGYIRALSARNQTDDGGEK